MSAMGQEQTKKARPATSALPSRRTISTCRLLHVRATPLRPGPRARLRDEAGHMLQATGSLPHRAHAVLRVVRPSE